jgi:hypothetical protein
MASTIRLKHGTSTGTSPSSLVQGEVAINVKDGKLFYGTVGGTSVSSSFEMDKIHATTSISASGGITGSFVQLNGSGYPIIIRGGGETYTISSEGAWSGQSATVATIAGLAPNTATTQATQPNITSLGTLTSLTVTGDITANGNIVGDNATRLSGLSHITSSGNISSSATITAEHFHSSDDVQIDDDLTVSGKGTFGDLAIETNGSNAILELERNSGAELKLKAQDNQSRITYEGGPLLFDRDESGTNSLTLGVGGHVTASGNISSSGVIHGRQFEQIIQNFTYTFAADGSTTIYLPWTDNDTENTSETNKFVNKVAAVPGRPVRTIIRALNNWDLAGGSGDKDPRAFTASFLTQEAFTSAANTINRMSVYTDSRQLGSSLDAREYITFDWRNPDSGSVGDCKVGDKLWMTLNSNNEEAGSYLVTTIFEWDYSL